MLHRLGERDARCAAQDRPAVVAARQGIQVDVSDRLGIGGPAIAEPRHPRLPRRAPPRRLHHRFRQRRLGGRAAQATTKRLAQSMLRQPQRPPVPVARPAWLVAPLCAGRRTRTRPPRPHPTARSWTNAAVSASACAPACRSQRPTGSYVCLVTSAAASRLPRRSTTSNVCATSAAGVFNRYSAVPVVGPKERAYPPQDQRGRPCMWPLPTVATHPHRGQGGFAGFAGRTIASPPPTASIVLTNRGSDYPKSFRPVSSHALILPRSPACRHRNAFRDPPEVSRPPTAGTYAAGMRGRVR